MSSRQIPLHVSSCYCYGYHFWSLSRVLGKSAYSRSNMKPKSIPKQARKWIEELFCWFQVLRQHFMFLSFCIHLHACSFIFLSFACIIHNPLILHSFPVVFLSCSFHVPFICIHFPSSSFHIPFIFIPMCIHVLSSSFHVHACSFHFAFMSFHFLSKVMEMALWLGQGTECNKWLSHVIAKLSLNNPSNIWHCSKEICHKNDRVRKREKTREREREWERYI